MDDAETAAGYAIGMLDYSSQRVEEILGAARTAVLASSGPGGLQAGEFPCEASGLAVWLLVPATSDHLFNLEHNPRVTLLTAAWELKGNAQVLAREDAPPGLSLLQDPAAPWCVTIRVQPAVLQIKGRQGWGYLETIEFE